MLTLEPEKAAFPPPHLYCFRLVWGYDLHRAAISLW